MFRKVYPLPARAVRYSDKPDVLIEGPVKIGIEITNFYVDDGSSPQSEQVQARRRIEAVSKAQRVYEADGGKNFQLSFGFNKKNPILDANDLINRLVDLAKSLESSGNGSVKKSLFANIPELEFVHVSARELIYPATYDDPEFPNGPPDISEGFTTWARYQNRREEDALRAGIYGPLSFTATWNLSQGHDFGIMSTVRLAEIVKEKESKTKEYAPCDSYWLLVVINFIDPAQE